MPGSPSLKRIVPAGKRSIRRLPPPCMSCADRDVSSADSTAETSASESSSPQGLCLPNDLRYQSLKSVRPDLCESVWSAP